MSTVPTYNESFINNLTNEISRIIIDSVFPSIVEGLGERGITVTCAELSKMLDLPLPIRSQPLTAPYSPSGARQVPAIAFGNSATPAAAKGRKRPVASPGEGCIYEFRRGPNEGRPCGKTRTIDSEFCSTHAKTQSAKAQGAKPTESKSRAKPPTYKDGATPALVSSAPSNSKDVKVRVFDEARGLYVETVHSLIIREIGDRIIAYGRLVGSDIVPLNENDVAIATNLDFQISSPEEIDGPVPEVELPSSTAPISSSTIASTPTGIPSIPSIPPLNVAPPANITPYPPASTTPYPPAGITTQPAAGVPYIPPIPSLRPSPYPAAPRHTVPPIPQTNIH